MGAGSARGGGGFGQEAADPRRRASRVSRRRLRRREHERHRAGRRRVEGHALCLFQLQGATVRGADPRGSQAAGRAYRLSRRRRRSAPGAGVVRAAAHRADDAAGNDRAGAHRHRARPAKFPSLGRAFYESGPCYGEIRLAERLEAWRAAGRCEFTDARLAARHFIDLCKSGVFSACLFGVTETATPEAIAETVDRAVEVFMRAYAVRKDRNLKRAAVHDSAASMSLTSAAGASLGA